MLRALITGALLLLAAGAGPGSAGAQPTRLPIFDTHLHYSSRDWASHPEERILAILDGAGVARALVSSTPDEGTVRLHRKAPDRIVPILRPYRTRDDMSGWWKDPSIVTYLEERLALGVHRGIGEFHLHGGDVDTPVMRQIAALAVRRGLPVHAHSDEAAVVALFALEPRLRILWAHAGMSSGPDVVGALLDRHPGLWVELALRNSDVAPGGTLDPAWRALFLRHPDRFMVGTDTWTTSRWEALPGSVEEVRRYLGQLPPDVAEALAWRNAERLFPR